MGPSSYLIRTIQYIAQSHFYLITRFRVWPIGTMLTRHDLCGGAACAECSQSSAMSLLMFFPYTITPTRPAFSGRDGRGRDFMRRNVITALALMLWGAGLT